MEINSNASVGLQNTQNILVKPTELSSQNAEKFTESTKTTKTSYELIKGSFKARSAFS